MQIENKILYDLAKLITEKGQSNHGLYIIGTTTGISIYINCGNALYRKVIPGDNTRTFGHFGATWTPKTGYIDTDMIVDMDMQATQVFDRERFGEFSVEKKILKKAIRGVSIVDGMQDIILSVHDGTMDIAAYTAEEYGYWQLDGTVDGIDGAIMVQYAYLDGLLRRRGYDTITLSYGHYQDKLVLYVSAGDIDAVIATLEIDRIRFMEVMDYEYHKPLQQIARAEPISVPAEPAVKISKKQQQKQKIADSVKSILAEERKRKEKAAEYWQRIA
jgi:hypothetical protein